MLTVLCFLCGASWQKPTPKPTALISHGLCPTCEGLYGLVIDGKMTLEKAKIEGRKYRVERAMRHGQDARAH